MTRPVLTLKLVLAILWVPSTVLSRVVIYPDDIYSAEMSSADFVPEEEPYTNLTMDQLISQAYGSAEAYMSDYFMNDVGEFVAELDMRLEPEQFNGLYDVGTTSKRKKRKATRPLRYRWTNKVVPYEFAPSHFNVREVFTVKQALQEWSDATCLTFRPATYNDRNKIRFQNGAGCNSALGMVGGTQAINLQSPSCRYKGLYLHEVGHAIGLVHEHQLPDRDEYIYILYHNVSPGLRIWFNKYSSREVNQYGVPYEYSSVMHYGVTAFSSDGRSKTIQVKDRSKEADIGRVYLKGLSFSDIKVVNLMYECNRHCRIDLTCQDPGYLDKNCQCVCPEGVDCTTDGGGGGGGGQECSNTWPGNQCDAWAARGECDANPTWMNVNCQNSCNTCPTGATTTATTTTAESTVTTTYMPSPPPSSTTTTTASTTPAATTESTTLTQPPPIELTSPVTGPPVGTTETTSQSTTATTTYMPSPPPTTTTTRPPTTSAPCTNSWGNYDCNNWARIEECRRNPVWMRQHCALACNVCRGGGGGGGGGRNCQDRHHYCGYWSRAGYCGTSSYMATYCRRSCGRCT